MNSYWTVEYCYQDSGFGVRITGLKFTTIYITFDNQIFTLCLFICRVKTMIVLTSYDY